MKEVKSLKKLLLKLLALTFLITFLASNIVSAQVRTVTGVVKDASGETIIFKFG